MPPRHVFWTIIYGNQPTSFRAATPEELLPTLRQLQRAHPDAVLKYFARGKLWNSAEEAQAARERRPREGRPPFRRDERRPPAPGDRRGKNWRPGGEHRDPRDRFNVPRDVKRARFAAKLRRDRLTPRPPRPGRPPKPPRKKDDE